MLQLFEYKDGRTGVPPSVELERLVHGLAPAGSLEKLRTSIKNGVWFPSLEGFPGSTEDSEPSLFNCAKRLITDETRTVLKKSSHRKSVFYWSLNCFCRALSLSQLMAESLSIFFGEQVFTEIDRSVYVYWVLDMLGKMETTLKSQTTYLSARILRQAPPARPERVFLLGKPFDRLLGRWFCKSKFTRKRIMLANTILQMKRCCPTVCQAFIAEAMRSHAQRLCCPKVESVQPTSLLWSLFHVNVDKILEEMKDPDPLRLHEPSQSGHFLSNRQIGGALGEALPYSEKKIKELRLRLSERSLSRKDIDASAVRSLILLDRAGCVDRNESHPPITAKQIVAVDGEWQGLTVKTTGVEAQLSFPQECYDRVQNWITEGPREIRAEAVPICEPCKVRVITLGETIPYLAGRSFQRAFANSLGSHPSLHFTRHALDEEGSSKVRLLLSKADAMYGARNYLVVSADYKDATDRLSTKASRYVASKLSTYHGDGKEQWKSQFEALCALLSQHQIHYDRKYFDAVPSYLEEVEETLPGYDAFNALHKEIRGVPAPKKGWTRKFLRGRQQDGQLMGSPISFTVLCLVNLAVIRSVLSLVGDKRAQELVLVNGDDGLFIIPKTHSNLYQLWESFSTSVGLALSPGKNYCVDAGSPMPFLTFNSKMYRLNWDEDMVVSLDFVPYVHSGLYKGWTKLEERIPDKANAEAGIGPRCRELLHGFLPEDQKRLRKRFLLHWQWAIGDPRIIHPAVATFLPEAYGGLGVPMLDGDQVDERRLRDARLFRALYQFPRLAESLGIKPGNLFELTKSNIFGRTALAKARDRFNRMKMDDVKLRPSREPFHEWEGSDPELLDLYLIGDIEEYSLKDDEPRYERFAFNRLHRVIAAMKQQETSGFIKKHVEHFSWMQAKDFWAQPFIVSDVRLELRFHLGEDDSRRNLRGLSGLSYENRLAAARRQRHGMCGWDPASTECLLSGYVSKISDICGNSPSLCPSDKRIVLERPEGDNLQRLFNVSN